MVATRRPAYSQTPIALHAFSANRGPRVPLVPAREHYVSEDLADAMEAPPEPQLDSVTDAMVIPDRLQQADRIFLGGFVLKEQGNSAKLFEDGMHQIMVMRNDDEGLRVILHDGNADFEHTIFVDSLNIP